MVLQLSCKKQSGRTKSEAFGNKFPAEADHLKWFRDAKFGMFIHWGPYSRLAGEWKGCHVPVGKQAEWIMKDFKIPVLAYRELAHKINPVRFDAKRWVMVAKAAGMKYIVVTAKHHDGFAMFKSRISSYNIVDWTPFKRDPLKELSAACAAEGVKFCIYYSHREDWDDPGGYGNDWDYDNDWGDKFFNQEKFGRYLENKAKPQLRELLTNYGPVGLVWFDRGMYTAEQAKEFVRLVKDLQPETLINSRVGNYSQESLGDYQSMGDNGMPPGGLDEYWESPQTLNSTWGYSKFDTLWKSPGEIILNLIEIVSRGGNYLLNIGPKGNGEIPEASVEILGKVGAWVERNAESIYGTTSSPFGELNWGYCTIKKNRLYLFVRDWPTDSVLSVPGLQNHVNSASLLIDKSTLLKFSQIDKQTSIFLPSRPPDNPVVVVVLDVEGSPQVDQQVVQQDENGSFRLDYFKVTTHGNAMTRFNRKGGFHISRWTGPDDYASWLIRVNKPGTFKVNSRYAANKGSNGSFLKINIGSVSIVIPVIYTGDWFEYNKFPAGYLKFQHPGDYAVKIHPEITDKNNLIWFKSIELDPVPVEKEEGWGAN